jgi:hypothetical protein
MRMKTLRACPKLAKRSPAGFPRRPGPTPRTTDAWTSVASAVIVLLGHEVVAISGPRRVPGGVLLRLTAFYLK